MDVEIIEIEDDEVSEVDETQFDLGREYWSNDEEEAVEEEEPMAEQVDNDDRDHHEREVEPVSFAEEPRADQEDSREVPEHVWCMHRSGGMRRLEDFLVSKDPDVSVWWVMRAQTFECQACMEGYVEAKREVLAFMERRAVDGDEISEFSGFRERLISLDRGFLLEKLRDVLDQLDSHQPCPDNFAFALYEILIDSESTPLKDAAIDDAFTRIMSLVGEDTEPSEGVTRKKMPGCYTLLTHPNANLRSWAVNMVRGMGTIRADEFCDVVMPAFTEWVKVFEDECLGSSTRQGEEPQTGGSAIRRENKEYWCAVKLVLELLERTDVAATTVLSRFPILSDVLFTHIEPTDADYLLHRDVLLVTSDCLRLFLDLCGPEVWTSTASWTPLGVFDSIVSTLWRQSVPDTAYKSALELLPPFLGSVRGMQHRADDDDGDEDLASLADRTLSALVRVASKLHPTGVRFRICNSVITRIVLDAYDSRSSSAATWPVASAEEWGPWLVARLTADAFTPSSPDKSGARESQRASAAAALDVVMAAQARDVRERIADAVRGIVDVESDARASAMLLCARTMHELGRRLPLAELPTTLRDRLFYMQSCLCLLPIESRLTPKDTAYSALVSACSDQSAVFASFVGRLMAANGMNPFALPDAGVNLGEYVVPILVGDHAQARRAMMRLLARGGPDAPTSMEACLTRVGSSTIKAAWTGVHTVLSHMRRCGYHGCFQAWKRLAETVVALLQRAPELVSQEEGPHRLWWRFAEEAFQAEGRCRHLDPGAVDSTYKAMLKACEMLVQHTPSSILRATHTRWLDALLTWAEDDVRVMEHVVDLLNKALETYSARNVPMQQELVERILNLATDSDSQLSQTLRDFTDGRTLTVECVDLEQPEPCLDSHVSLDEGEGFAEILDRAAGRPKPASPRRTQSSNGLPRVEAVATPQAARQAPSAVAGQHRSPFFKKHQQRPTALSTVAPQRQMKQATQVAPVSMPAPSAKPSTKPKAASSKTNVPAKRTSVSPAGQPVQITAGNTEDDMEIYLHLRELAKNNKVIEREFHRRICMWRLHDLLEGTGVGRGICTAPSTPRKLDTVPVRFLDHTHYKDIFEPLLLEECRCALGKDLEDRVNNSGDTWRGRGRKGAAGRPGKTQEDLKPLALNLHNVVKDLEDDGLYTLHMTVDLSRLDGRMSKVGSRPHELFLLRPRRKKAATSLEDGEVSDEDDDHAPSGEPTVLDLKTEVQHAHFLAVLTDVEQKNDAGGKGKGHDDIQGDPMRFRVFVSHQERGPKFSERDLRPGSGWQATVVGNLTTSYREFCAVREMARVKLAPRLINGGRELGTGGSRVQQLQVVTLEDLTARWHEIAQVEKRCGTSLDACSQTDLQELNRQIKALKQCRVSMNLLEVSGLGRELHNLKKRMLWHEETKATCERVINSYKRQVQAEKACYGRKKDIPVVPQTTGGQDSENMKPGASSDAADAVAKQNSAGPVQGSTSTDFVRCPIQVPIALWKELCKLYNTSQLRAIAAACHTNSYSFARHGEITLLQGPPGTGKTRTILGLLSSLLHSSQRWEQMQRQATRNSEGPIRPAPRLSASRANRILVCAPSNGAVDEIVLRLQETGLLDANGRKWVAPLVRIGAIDPESHQKVQAATLDAQVAAKIGSSMEEAGYQSAEREVGRCLQVLRDVGSELRSARGRLAVGDVDGKSSEAEREGVRVLQQKQRHAKLELARAQKQRWECHKALEALRSRTRTAIIRNAKIVLSTLSSTASQHLSDAVVATSYGFGTCVIDEAGQTVEPSAIIPLRYGCRNLILVGDPRQLPATIISPTVAKLGYDKSLFERLEKGGQPVHMLTVQYRMHPEIRVFPSNLFYAGKLSDADFLIEGANEDPRVAEALESKSVLPVVMPYHRLPYFRPYLLFDVRGYERRTNMSVSNDVEADFAVQLFRRLHAEYPQYATADRVAVITPYKSQVRTLQRAFEKELGREWAQLIQLSTVDGFQGREKDVIIFSSVRADPHAGIGFLKDRRRMNVGLTRARRCLLVLGHVAALSTDESWRALVDDARTRNLIVETGGRPFDEVRRRLLREAGLPDAEVPITRQQDFQYPVPVEVVCEGVISRMSSTSSATDRGVMQSVPQKADGGHAALPPPPPVVAAGAGGLGGPNDGGVEQMQATAPVRLPARDAPPKKRSSGSEHAEDSFLSGLLGRCKPMSDVASEKETRPDHRFHHRRNTTGRTSPQPQLDEPSHSEVPPPLTAATSVCHPPAKKPRGPDGPQTTNGRASSSTGSASSSASTAGQWLPSKPPAAPSTGSSARRPGAGQQDIQRAHTQSSTRPQHKAHTSSSTASRSADRHSKEQLHRSSATRDSHNGSSSHGHGRPQSSYNGGSKKPSASKSTASRSDSRGTDGDRYASSNRHTHSRGGAESSSHAGKRKRESPPRATSSSAAPWKQSAGSKNDRPAERRMSNSGSSNSRSQRDTSSTQYSASSNGSSLAFQSAQPKTASNGGIGSASFKIPKKGESNLNPREAGEQGGVNRSMPKKSASKPSFSVLDWV